jgi:hypothetical protein
MSYHYDPSTAPRAYLKRVFIDTRPRSITMICIIGTTRIFTYNLADYYEVLQTDRRDRLVAEAIVDDQTSRIHECFSKVKYYLLVIDGQIVACYDTLGSYIDDGSGHELRAEPAGFVIRDEQGHAEEFIIRDVDDKPKLNRDH